MLDITQAPPLLKALISFAQDVVRGAMICYSEQVTHQNIYEPIAPSVTRGLARHSAQAEDKKQIIKIANLILLQVYIYEVYMYTVERDDNIY